MRGEAIAEAYDAFEKGATASPMTQAAISNQTIQESMRLILMVRSFQVRLAYPSLAKKHLRGLEGRLVVTRVQLCVHVLCQQRA